MHTERTWIPCAPVCTSSASQRLRTYDLYRHTYLPQLTGKGHDCSYCWYFLSVCILDPLITREYSKFHHSYPLFTPFVPWQNQMDLLWPQVRKLELVPTQKKHQWCHFMSSLVWVTNHYIQRLAVEHIASATSGNLQHTGKPTTWALYSVAIDKLTAMTTISCLFVLNFVPPPFTLL